MSDEDILSISRTAIFSFSDVMYVKNCLPKDNINEKSIRETLKIISLVGWGILSHF